MMNKLLMVFMITLVLACSNQVNDSGNIEPGNILAVFAHPDDETWISGTLAKFASRGVKVTSVYLTSGDRGDDYSGANLTGKALADVRETEAIKANKILGLSAPIFLRYGDGKVKKNQSAITANLTLIINELQPQFIITFDGGGITGNSDHIATGFLVTNGFANKVIHFGVSRSRADKISVYANKQGIEYKVKNPVADTEISYRVDVNNFSEQRINAMAQYETQFPKPLMAAFADFALNLGTEELIVKGVEHKKQLIKLVGSHDAGKTHK